MSVPWVPGVQMMTYGIPERRSERHRLELASEIFVEGQMIRRFTRADFLRPPSPQGFGAPASILYGYGSTMDGNTIDDVPLTLCPGVACWILLPFFQPDVEKRRGSRGD